MALGAELLSQGAREGRDLREYNLDKMWSDAKGANQFVSYAQNILDRRMKNQDAVPVGLVHAMPARQAGQQRGAQPGRRRHPAFPQ